MRSRNNEINPLNSEDLVLLGANPVDADRLAQDPRFTFSVNSATDAKLKFIHAMNRFRSMNKWLLPLAIVLGVAAAIAVGLTFGTFAIPALMFGALCASATVGLAYLGAALYSAVRYGINVASTLSWTTSSLGLGVAIGAVLGTVIFPGLGTHFGAVIGAFAGAAFGAVTAFIAHAVKNVFAEPEATKAGDEQLVDSDELHGAPSSTASLMNLNEPVQTEALDGPRVVSLEVLPDEPEVTIYKMTGLFAGGQNSATQRQNEAKDEVDNHLRNTNV